MPRKTTTRASNGRLEEALTNLLNTQAQFVGHLGRMDERFARNDERFVRMDERFARIENDLNEIKRILRRHEALLLHHQEMLEALPEAIRQKIGFKGRG